MKALSKPPASIAIRVLEAEARAIAGLVHRVDDRFSRALDILAGCTGKIAVTGMEIGRAHV